jgi:hypothetical protein
MKSLLLTEFRNIFPSENLDNSLRDNAGLLIDLADFQAIPIYNTVINLC